MYIILGGTVLLYMHDYIDTVQYEAIDESYLQNESITNISAPLSLLILSGYREIVCSFLKVCY